MIAEGSSVSDTTGVLRLERLFRPWVERVAHLRAWGRPMTEVCVELRERRDGRPGTTGLAWPVKRKILLRIGTNPALAIGTALHEFAHVAAPGDVHHGGGFKTRLRAAVIELTGHDPGLIENYRTFDRSCDDAVSDWWRATHAKAWDIAEKFARNAGGAS